VLSAGLAGFVLGVCGAAMQALFKNPLASPDILGVSSGGALGAVVGISLGWPLIHPWLVPAAAFAGALAAALGVYGLATRGGRTDTATLLLSGAAVSSLCAAVISLLYHFMDDGILRQVVYWLMGNLAGKRWEHLAAVTPLAVLGSAGLWLLAADLNALLGGEDDARSLGVPVERTKRWVLVLASLATGAVVSVAGIIGFVGVIVPHMVRLVAGPDHRWLLPASGLAGAAFLIAADAVARTAFSPVEIRTGIVTALCGAPFFLFLLSRRRDVTWG
ncbi:MAG: iron chelate uptake ABC transporter family permease subunit, partial [Firmicutes bacterium]|nr:iron chelate uptake ABC transporter family permease subunit [Bacillota bacterium]